MTSNQKLVQSYLERHGIGPLFEEMMAKIIKDMPNEPIVYLMKFLQKFLKRFEGTDKRIFSPPTSRGMGLVGSSIPKKHSSDPQVVLPGSKKVVSSWSKGDTESVASGDSRGYNKPWLVNMKKNKNKKDAQGIKSPNQNFDDLFDQENSPKKNLLSKSLPVPAKDEKEPHNDTKWTTKKTQFSDDNNNKENTPPIQNKLTPNEDDELQISKDKEYLAPARKSTFSPSEYSKVKRHSSKKKAIQQKQKLQQLLTNDESIPINNRQVSKETTDDDDDDDDDDEGIDVFENDTDLASEGVNVKLPTHAKRPVHKGSCSNNDVTVSVCSRCAKLITGGGGGKMRENSDGSGDEPFFKPSSKRQSNVLSDDDDDIESVSQIGTSKPFKPRWPVLSDSEGETIEEKQRKQTIPAKLKNVNFHTNPNIEGDKSDFFERNSPLRKKTKPLGRTMFSDDDDDESEATFVKSSNQNKLKSLSKQSAHKAAWTQQTANDTASEEEDEEEQEEFTSTRLPVKRGFQLKEALVSDDGNSDVL